MISREKIEPLIWERQGMIPMGMLVGGRILKRVVVSFSLKRVIIWILEMAMKFNLFETNEFSLYSPVCSEHIFHSRIRRLSPALRWLSDSRMIVGMWLVLSLKLMKKLLFHPIY